MSISDEELFKLPSLNEECPICLVPLPHNISGSSYQSCCGKTICRGCTHVAMTKAGGLVYTEGNYAFNLTDKPPDCPFCRTAPPTSAKEVKERFRKRMKLGDPLAFFNYGCFFTHGKGGCEKDLRKAFGLYLRAAELGSFDAHYALGLAYENGDGVERDKKKSLHHYELAAIAGHPNARHNLGCYEDRVPNLERSLKHYTVAAGMGFTDSLNQIKHMYQCGPRYATKADYTKALRTYQSYTNEVKTSERDKAAAFGERFQYL